ncbi:MAG: hypothetical protein F4020_02195 [Gammaproteobacteria bacterium]|nr:hypothetical protein [Gammaproteobacteria bacterium]MYK68399.1 hypothetical protein [Gammaproteobacteria bacterium]
MPLTGPNELQSKVKNLNELLWEDHVTLPTLEVWLSNFSGGRLSREAERRHALYLLSKFLYFGQTEVRQLLRAMFRDLIRSPLSVDVRAALGNREDFAAVHSGFLTELERTRFLGLGTPAESGPHILYDFRLANSLPTEAFVSPLELVTGPLRDPKTEWGSPTVRRLIFVDDFCGTGSQAIALGRGTVRWLRAAATRSAVSVEVWYLALFGTTTGLSRLRDATVFDRVATVSELDDTYRVFEPESQLYGEQGNDLRQSDGEAMARHYGRRLHPTGPLGHGDCQLLLGFHHNVPDNTLPIFWAEQSQPPWRALFPRIPKQ